MRPSPHRLRERAPGLLENMAGNQGFQEIKKIICGFEGEQYETETNHPACRADLPQP